MIKPQVALAGLGDDEALRCLLLTHSLYRVLGRTAAGGSDHTPSASQVPQLELGNHKTPPILQEYIGQSLGFCQLSSRAQGGDGANHCGEWDSMARSSQDFSCILKLSSSAHFAIPDPFVIKLLNCPSQPRCLGPQSGFVKPNALGPHMTHDNCNNS